MIKLQLFKYVDLTVLPKYATSRVKFLNQLGLIPPPLLAGEFDEETLNSLADLQQTSLEQIHAHLASTLWTKQVFDVSNPSDYHVAGIGVYEENEQPQILLILRDSFTGQQTPIPLTTFLRLFKPVGEIQPNSYH